MEANTHFVLEQKKKSQLNCYNLLLIISNFLDIFFKYFTSFLYVSTRIVADRKVGIDGTIEIEKSCVIAIIF